MGYARRRPAHVGAWYNSLSDLWGDIQAIAGGGNNAGGGTFTPSGYRPPALPPGANLPPYFASPMGLSSQDASDLDVIQTWRDNVQWAGGVAVRMPKSMPNAGELAARMTGPGTSLPNERPPYTYILAPAAVLQADHRAGQALQAQIDTVVPRANDDPTFSDALTTALKWGAVALGVALIVPQLLPSRR